MTEELNEEGLQAARRALITAVSFAPPLQDYSSLAARTAIEVYFPYYQAAQAEEIKELKDVLREALDKVENCCGCIGEELKEKIESLL